MKCPYCRRDDDRVIDSRTREGGFAIRRRRACNMCGRRYTTYERISESDLKVVKKGGAREPFRLEKIKSGLQRACWKRPISEEQIEDAISNIEQAIYSNYDSEIESQQLGRIVMEELASLDQVAYVRFASVYREFTDVRDFVNELTPMLNRPKARASRPVDGVNEAQRPTLNSNREVTSEPTSNE